MAEDIAPALLEQLRAAFLENLESDKTAARLLEEIQNGTATYATAGDYAEQVGTALADAFSAVLTADALPDGKMYWNIADRVVLPLLEQDYELVSDAAVQVQTALNQAAGIGIKAQKAALNTDKVDGLLNKISAADSYDNVAWVLGEPVKTFSRSVVDDTVKANAEFQSNAGLHPKIVRKAEFKCCEWCSALAGTYEYPDVPDDIYRRHENCRCTVEYDPGSGKRQNVWTKKWTNTEDSATLEARKTVGLDDGKDDKSLLSAARRRIGNMTASEYAEYKRELASTSSLKQIYLPKQEYAKVMSELNTHLSDEDRKHALVSKPIGNYIYTVINNGFDNYIVVGKTEIESSIQDFLRRQR